LRAGTVHAITLVLVAATSLATAGAPYRGRPLVEVLEELRARGAELVYSSALVDERMVVTVEPRSTEPRDILHEILPPLGLEAREGPGGAILIVPSERALSGRLTGRVVSASRLAAIGGAEVTLSGRVPPARTRADGSFRFDDVAPGAYALRVEATGFSEALRGDVRVTPGNVTNFVVELRPLPRFAEEIVVTPSRHALVQEDPAARTTVEAEEALRAPAIGGDVSRVLALLPGVAAPDNSAALNVRGGTSRDVSFVLDGLELYEPFHLKDFQSPFSVVDPALAESIELSSAGGTVERGDRHGGFIRLAIAPPTDVSRGRVEVGTMNTRLAYGGPAPAGSVLATTRVWYPDAVRDTIELGEEGLDPRFADVYATYAITSIPGTILSFHTLAARDELEFVEADGAEQVEATSRSAYLWARLLRSWSATVSSETLLSAGSIERRRQGVSEPEDVAFSVDDRRDVSFFGLRHDTEVRVSSAHLVRAGLEIRPIEADYDYVTTEGGSTSVLRLSPGGTSYAAYAAYRAAVTDRFALEGGVRWDRQAFLDQAYVSPRLHVVARPGPRTELKVSAGRHFQSQRIHELNVPDGQLDFVRAERSDQLDLSCTHRFPPGLDLRVDAYARRIIDVQPRWENLFDPLELFPETEADRVEIAASEAKQRGLEITLRGRADRRLFWWLSYARSSVVDVEAGRDVPRSWDQPHAGRGLIGYRWDRGWSVSLASSVHTGWPTTPVSGRAVLQPDGSTEIEPVLGPRNADRFPTYARFDLQVARSFPVRRGRIYVRLDVVNVTDRDNACCVDDFVFTERPDGTIATEPETNEWLGITPSVALGWEF
jgi:outer membrane receptor protein involved in Fe transport